MTEQEAMGTYWDTGGSSEHYYVNINNNNMKKVFAVFLSKGDQTLMQVAQDGVESLWI